MDTALKAANAAMCIALGGALSWAIMSERVRDGIVVKLGMILAAFGFFGMAALLAEGAASDQVARAMAMIHAGLLVGLAGLCVRRWRARRRRTNDWWIL